MNSMTSHHARRHPFLAFLAFLIFGPYLIGAALIVGLLFAAGYLVGGLIFVVSGRRIV